MARNRRAVSRVVTRAGSPAIEQPLGVPAAMFHFGHALGLFRRELIGVEDNRLLRQGHAVLYRTSRLPRMWFASRSQYPDPLTRGSPEPRCPQRR